MELTPQEFANLDYLYKKYVASKAKTDSTTTRISIDNELFNTFPIVRSNNVWLDSDKLLDGPFNSNSFDVVESTFVKSFSVHGIGETQDFPNLIGFSWNSGIKDWIDPSFNIDFTPVFYIVPNYVTSSSTIVIDNYPTILPSDPTYPFIFDYQSGILTFTLTPALSEYYSYNLTLLDLNANSFTTSFNIWVSGYRYTGKTLSNLSTVGPSGPQGPPGETTSIQFDGGSPSSTYAAGPVFDCGNTI